MVGRIVQANQWAENVPAPMAAILTVALTAALAVVLLSACALSSVRVTRSLTSQRPRAPASVMSVNDWCQRVMMAARSIQNQRQHLGGDPDEYGRIIEHPGQRGAVPFHVKPPEDILRAGQDAEAYRASSSNSEGETCLRSAHLVFHGASSDKTLRPPGSPPTPAEALTRTAAAMRAHKYVIVFSKPCDGLSMMLWNVTGNCVDGGGKGHLEGFYNAANGRIVWTETVRNVRGTFGGRNLQSIFYGQLAVITDPRAGSAVLSAPSSVPAGVSPDFFERQTQLLAKQPVWMLHGCFVSENNLTGALLSFSDESLSPKVAAGARLTWREMGDSVTTAKRALQIGRFQLQRLQIDERTGDQEAPASLLEHGLESGQLSCHTTLARFFLSHDDSLAITDLLAAVATGPASGIESGSMVSGSDHSMTVASTQFGSESYQNPITERGRASSLAARSLSLGSMV